jgi:DNA repair exonuclease SbcCD nuclease subunit
MADPVFIHAADLHLGAPLRQLGKGLKEDVRQRLRELAGKAFTNLIELTIERDAEFLLLAGDIYDRAEREAASQFAFRKGIERLAAERIKVYITHGNHDPVSRDLVTLVKFDENHVKVFGPNQEEVVEHTLRDGSRVLIAGISYWQEDVKENLVPRLSKAVSNFGNQDVRAVIGLLHTNVNSPDHDPYAPCSVADLQSSPMHYWALGHVHKRSVNTIGDNRYWAYPGNLQGRFFKEVGSKGALVVPILARGVGTPEHVPCDVIRFEHLSIDCSNLAFDNPDKEIADKCVFSDSGRRPIVARITLTGQSSVALQKLEKVNEREDVLVGQLNGLLEARLLGGGVDSVVYNIQPEIDFDKLRSEDSLTGDLLGALDTEDLVALYQEHLRAINSEIKVLPSDAEEIRANILSDLVPRLLKLT